jgi:hypothetical protein
MSHGVDGPPVKGGRFSTDVAMTSFGMMMLQLVVDKANF